MSRRYRGEPIEVATDACGSPVRFRWRGRRYVIRTVVGMWVEALPWWSDHLRASGQRQVWRVEAVRGSGGAGVYDLHRTPGIPDERWALARVID
jgi:hypothetical protein